MKKILTKNFERTLKNVFAKIMMKVLGNFKNNIKMLWKKLKKFFRNSEKYFCEMM